MDALSGIEVGVMYVDLSTEWSLLEECGRLPRDGVLFIVATTRRGDRKALVRRVWGKDQYVVWWDADNWLIEGYDDTDSFWRVKSLTVPHENWKAYLRRLRWPTGGTTVHFRGTFVIPEQWKTSLQRFDAELF